MNRYSITNITDRASPTFYILLEHLICFCFWPLVISPAIVVIVFVVQNSFDQGLRRGYICNSFRSFSLPFIMQEAYNWMRCVHLCISMEHFMNYTNMQMSNVIPLSAMGEQYPN